MAHIIFSIDNQDNAFALNCFQNFISSIDGASDIKHMIGCYQGKRENAWIWDSADFDKYLRGSIFVKHQESFLHIASGNKMEATLEFQETGHFEPLGCMHEVSEEEAKQADAWSYRPDMKTYWVAKQGNPDRIYNKLNGVEQCK